MRAGHLQLLEAARVRVPACEYRDTGDRAEMLEFAMLQGSALRCDHQEMCALADRLERTSLVLADHADQECALAVHMQILPAPAQHGAVSTGRGGDANRLDTIAQWKNAVARVILRPGEGKILLLP